MTTSPGTPESELSSRSVVSIRSLLSDAAVYGLASIADRAIGFALLPLMTVLLSPSDYGILNLFTTTAHLAFIFCSLCIHQAFLRYYTDAAHAQQRNDVINTSLSLALTYWVGAMPLLVVFREPLSRLIFGSSHPDLILVLSAVMAIETFDSLAGNRLQADGRPWALFWIRISGSLAMRTAGVIAILYGAGVWGWILADAIGRAISAGLVVAVAFHAANLRWRRELISPLASYGAKLVPAMLSFYAMTVTDKFAIRALLPSPLDEVGFYSVGERIAGIMHLVNLAFILGWQRFAFRNMHLRDGERLIARGMLMFAIGSGYLATCLGLLGDDLTHWLIASKFERGMVVIVPLTFAAALGGLASAAEVGLHKGKKALTISTLNVAAAVVNLVLNCLMIPRFGIAGAAYSTLVAQAGRLALVWWSSQQALPLDFDYRRLGAACAVFAAAFAAGQLLQPMGWIAATTGQLAIAAAAIPYALWTLPIFPDDLRGQLSSVIGRFRRRKRDP